MYGPTNQLTITVIALSTNNYGHRSHCVKKKIKSQNTSLKYVCIIAEKVPLLTILTVAVKQWFMQQQAIL